MQKKKKKTKARNAHLVVSVSINLYSSPMVARQKLEQTMGHFTRCTHITRTHKHTKGGGD